ncbi:rrg1, partial [Symbiodinium pilosum]
FFYGPGVLQTPDRRLYRQRGASIWKADGGRFLEVLARVPLETFMKEKKATPTIEIADHAGDNVRGSWESSTALANTHSRGPKRGVQVPVCSIERIISDHTVVKIDVEGSKLPLLPQPRDRKQVRLLIFEFSAARCRKHAVGPLPFVFVLEASHKRRLHAFVHPIIFRFMADDDQAEMCRWSTPEMQSEMSNLPALLKAMPLPQKKVWLGAGVVLVPWSCGPLVQWWSSGA